MILLVAEQYTLEDVDVRERCQLRLVRLREVGHEALDVLASDEFEQLRGEPNAANYRGGGLRLADTPQPQNTCSSPRSGCKIRPSARRTHEKNAELLIQGICPGVSQAGAL